MKMNISIRSKRISLWLYKKTLRHFIVIVLFTNNIDWISI